MLYESAYPITLKYTDQIYYYFVVMNVIYHYIVAAMIIFEIECDIKLNRIHYKLNKYLLFYHVFVIAFD